MPERGRSSILVWFGVVILITEVCLQPGRLFPFALTGFFPQRLSRLVKVLECDVTDPDIVTVPGPCPLQQAVEPEAPEMVMHVGDGLAVRCVEPYDYCLQVRTGSYPAAAVRGCVHSDAGPDHLRLGLRSLQYRPLGQQLEQRVPHGVES